MWTKLKEMGRIAMIAVLATLVSIAGPVYAAGTASVHLKNATGRAVWAVMDTEREVHLIAPGAQEVFHKANIFDSPTLRLYEVGANNSRGALLHARDIGIISPFHSHEHWTWDGARLSD
ncbi:hypothetical protein V5E97_25080 [Singulisphaera sp. Ch08]|uniref:Uncharacterized protein n=1 Tax=Singulisphaera sp. Ch08 TaxID=3120278 RepID=A0AAU7C907_9BACT